MFAFNLVIGVKIFIKRVSVLQVIVQLMKDFSFYMKVMPVLIFNQKTQTNNQKNLHEYFSKPYSTDAHVQDK